MAEQLPEQTSCSENAVSKIKDFFNTNFKTHCLSGCVSLHWVICFSQDQNDDGGDNGVPGSPLPKRQKRVSCLRLRLRFPLFVFGNIFH